MAFQAGELVRGVVGGFAEFCGEVGSGEAAGECAYASEGVAAVLEVPDLRAAGLLVVDPGQLGGSVVGVALRVRCRGASFCAVLPSGSYAKEASPWGVSMPVSWPSPL